MKIGGLLRRLGREVCDVAMKGTVLKAAQLIWESVVKYFLVILKTPSLQNELSEASL